MMDFKAMSTPMTTNLKLLNDKYLEIVDVTLYRQIIGSLMYLTNMTNMRLDICFVVNTISQYMVEPIHVHLVATKHVMRYTLDYGLRYASDGEIILHGFTNSDWAGSAEDRKSTSGCSFSLGSGVIS